MTALAIMDGLQRLAREGDAAEQAARLGFLEWVFALPPDASPQQAASRALDGLDPPEAPSAAAAAFLEFLEQATRPSVVGATRRGGARGRRRALH